MLNSSALRLLTLRKAAPAVLALSVYSGAHAVEPRLYQLGEGGAIAPHLQLELGSDSNPLRQADGSDASGFMRLQPSLRYVVQRRNNNLQITYRGNYYQYFEDYCFAPVDVNCPNGSPQFDKASFQDHAFTADGFLEITRKLRASASLEQSIENQPIGTGLSANAQRLASLQEPDAFRSSSLRAQISYGAPGARGEIRGSVTFTDKEYFEGAVDAPGSLDGLNESSSAPSATLLYRLGNKSQIFSGFSQYEVRGGNSERDVTQFFAGVELDASAITSGSFRVTSVLEDFVEAREDLEYIGWEAEITWRPRRYSTVVFKGGRETSRGVFNAEDVGITTEIDLDWRHAWRDRFSTLARLALVINDETAGSDANDSSTRIRLQGDYNIRRWLDIGAFFVSDQRDGDGVERDYSRTVIGLTVDGTF